MTMREFREANQREFHAIPLLRPPDKHVDKLLAELETEVPTGRVRGPLTHPKGWPAYPTSGEIPICGPEVGHCDESELAYAWGFSIEQDSGPNPKLRRGDDWKRSFHNATAFAEKTPAHHTVDTHVDHVKALHEAGDRNLRFWSHDQQAEYRVLPMRHPFIALLVLVTQLGPLLYQHLVLHFGGERAQSGRTTGSWTPS